MAGCESQFSIPSVRDKSNVQILLGLAFIQMGLTKGVCKEMPEKALDAVVERIIDQRWTFGDMLRAFSTYRPEEAWQTYYGNDYGAWETFAKAMAES